MTLKANKKNRPLAIIKIFHPLKSVLLLCLIILTMFGFTYVINLSSLISKSFIISQQQSLLKEESNKNKDLIQELSAKLSRIKIQELAKELNLVPSATTFYLKDLSQSPLSLLNQNKNANF